MSEPRVSIITATLNAEEHLRETLDTLMRQSLSEWELLIMDAGSTDSTLDIVASYDRPNIRVFQEPDEGGPQAWDRGIDRACGDFVMLLCASDGFLYDTYITECVEILDADPEVSLVRGIPVKVDEDGTNPQPFGIHPASIERYQKRDWLLLWLATGMDFPDFNMCVRRPVLRTCMTPYRPGTRIVDKYQEFLYNFNTRGYLPYGLTTMPVYSREHADRLSNDPSLLATHKLAVSDYVRRSKRYRRQLEAGALTHYFRDGAGQVIGQLESASGIPNIADFNLTRPGQE
jgi:glycosyltransferase involved in cell wall biosynthesis